MGEATSWRCRVTNLVGSTVLSHFSGGKEAFNHLLEGPWLCKLGYLGQRRCTQHTGLVFSSLVVPCLEVVVSPSKITGSKSYAEITKLCLYMWSDALRVQLNEVDVGINMEALRCCLMGR